MKSGIKDLHQKLSVEFNFVPYLPYVRLMKNFVTCTHHRILLS